MADETLGKYEIRGQLGRGAMGTVLDGWDPIIARRVAIKTVRLPDPSDAEAQEELARFKREAQAAGRLNHPNIVGVFDYGETGEVAFIVMEFVDGRTLKAVLDRNERMALPEIARVMGDILAGLQFSHDRGVVHRDIKPANIMITQAGQAKIADFGIARIESSSMTQAGTVLGTPAYMSPEQFMGQVVDLRTDIYSCGVLLYQLLTGERPFEGSMTAIMHKALNTAPPKPSDLSVTSPPALDAVVARAMAKRPEDRFRTATALATAIADAVTAPAPGLSPTSIDDLLGTSEETMVARPAKPSSVAAGVDAVPATPAVPVVGKPRRSGAAVGVAAVVLLAALGGGAYVLFGGNTRTDVADLRTPAPPSSSTSRLTPTPTPPPSPTSGLTPTAPPSPTPTSVTPTPISPLTPLPTTTSTSRPTPTPTPQRAPGPQVPQPTPTQQAAITPIPAVPTRPAPSLTPAPTPVSPAPTVPPASVPTPSSPQPTAPTPAVVPVPAPLTPQVPSPTVPSSPAPVPQPIPAPTAVEPAPLSPAMLRQMIAPVVATAPCGLIAAEVNDAGTTVTVTGLAANAGKAALRRTVEARAAGADVVWQVAGFDGPYCPAVEAIRAVAGRASGLVATPNKTTLHDNDLLILQATLPDFPAHLQIDYLDSHGGITHLVPTTPDVDDHTIADRLYAARSRARFGDPVPPRYKGLQVGPPPGTDMILVIASQTPLMALHTQVEDRPAHYLAELQAAVEAARRRGRVAATAFLLDIAVP